ncbi:hypothetical protein A6723_001855 [Pseudomonas sp. AU11447]|nr:hypothetical protein A6723_001855 [Pseudomonas sp. AU11447]
MKISAVLIVNYHNLKKNFRKKLKREKPFLKINSVFSVDITTTNKKRELKKKEINQFNQLKNLFNLNQLKNKIQQNLEIPILMKK